LVFLLLVLLYRTVLVFCILPSLPHARTISIVSWLVYFLSLLAPGPILFFHYGCGLVLFSPQSVGNISFRLH
jgi:hypothetical protein